MNILLVHGLGRTPLSMFGLASALRKAGHHTTFFGYSSTFESISRIVRRLTRKLETLGRAPIGLVGHSLGGILLRMALAQSPKRSVAHFVMLGTPNQPPRMARWAWRVPPFRFGTRECGRLLATPALYADVPPIKVPHTVIAGTAGPCGQWSPFGSEANDGVVAVAEARVSPSHSPLLVPAFHSFLMDNSVVRRLVAAQMAHAVANPGEADS